MSITIKQCTEEFEFGFCRFERYTHLNLGSKKQQLPPLDTKPSGEDILNAILPPNEWVENGKHYISYVSHTPASRVDVARLRENLDSKLMDR